MPYKNQLKTVAGKEGKEIMLFALSTCVWCRKTKALLGELGLKYSYVDVDLLDNDDENEVYAKIKKHNPGGSFPLLVINNGEKIIIGFNESEIKNLNG